VFSDTNIQQNPFQLSHPVVQAFIMLRFSKKVQIIMGITYRGHIQSF